ncbi:MAG: hypothetical protein HXS48_05825, partial [Theionarchaea archaeon]|nr:hypothetical protein [Theionarchaea archaeon]
VQKRAVPSHGRARLHTSMLTELGVQEGSKLEIINEPMSKKVTVTLFADSLVEEGYIRLSAEDLDALGLYEGDIVAIRRKPPISEQVRKEAAEAAERVTAEVGKAGEKVEEAAGRVAEKIETGVDRAGKEVGEAAGTVKEEVVKAYGRVVEEAAPVAEKIEGATREAVGRIKEEVTPVTERVEGAAKEAYARIMESPLRERVSKATESFISKLQPGEEAKLKQVLEECKGSIQTVTVTSDVIADKLVREIELPEEVVISAVQRNKEIIIPKGDTRLVRGDIVYLVGKEEGLRECAALMEG